VELLDAASEREHYSLARLGPDILDDDLDLDEIRRRARAAPADTRIGELLLDQRVVAGIGNIYRCESLFRARTDPYASVGSLDDDALDAVIREAAKLMRASTAARAQPWVYRRGRKPCRRCRGAVVSEPMGDPPRMLHWCPGCQRCD
jgi:endonuclease-8